MSWIETPNSSKYNISALGIDEAWINNVTSEAAVPLWLYELSTDCHGCPYQRTGDVNELLKYSIRTMHPMKYRFRTEGLSPIVLEESDSAKFCELEYNFGEFGVYEIAVSGNSAANSKCGVNVLVEPVNIYLPILIAALFYLFLALVVWFTSTYYQRIKKLIGFSSASSRTSSKTEINPADTNDVRLSPTANIQLGNDIGNNNAVMDHHHPSPTTEITISTITSIPTSTESEKQESPSAIRRTSNAHTLTNGNSNSNSNQKSQSQPLHSQNSASSTAQQKPSPPRQRLRSLDTFRGMCIIIMIFVNDGGAHYYFTEHATWDGLYIADLVFPWFLWCMGISTAISISSQVKRKTPRLTIFRRIVWRSFKLVAIGIMLSTVWGAADIEKMRLPGVLQRFGICYLVTSTLVLLCMTVSLTAKPTETSKFKAALQDVQTIWMSWVFVLLLVMTHCLLTFFLPVPGCPTGYLGPGGLHDNARNPAFCIGGATGYIDRQVLTLSHLYQNPTAKYTYKAGAFDPEGILGLLTSVFQVWLGVQTGVTMLVFPRPSSRLKRWGAWAVATGATGALLCGCQQTGGWIPINKNLWSLSFVLVTSCFAFTALSILYFIIDMKKWWTGSPFYEPGMNSILLYVGHSIGHSALPWHYRYGPMKTHFSRLVESLWGTSLWVIIAVYLFQKDYFWTL